MAKGKKKQKKNKKNCEHVNFLLTDNVCGDMLLKCNPQEHKVHIYMYESNQSHIRIVHHHNHRTNSCCSEASKN